jgi:hypothetical protein
MAYPAKYDPQLHPQLIKWMARAGLIDAEIAAELKISKVCLYRWKAKYPEVAAALVENKDFADSLVEDSLFKRARGYRYKETKITGTKNPDGTVKAERVEQIEKEIPPDTGACALWLKNRRRPGRDKDPRFTWQDTYRVERDPAPLERPQDELTNDELDAEIAALEKAYREEEGKAAPETSPGKLNTLH